MQKNVGSVDRAIRALAGRRYRLVPPLRAAGDQHLRRQAGPEGFGLN